MVVIDESTCVGCGKCLDDCVSMSLFLREGKAEYAGNCINCGHCVAICPARAVSIPEYDMEDVHELGAGGSMTIDMLLNTIKSRRSIRRYTSKKIERSKLVNIIQAGRYTATAVNRQACTFVLVQEQLETLKQMVWGSVEKAVAEGLSEAEPLKRLVGLRNKKNIDYLFRDAPATLYIAAENMWDAGLAAQNMELAIVSQGLGALYNGFLVRSTMLSEDAKEMLHLDGKPLAVNMLLGYPDVGYISTAPRKKADVVWL